MLALPGPTNALFAAAGATDGFRRALRLVPLAILAYGIAIAALIAVVGGATGSRPQVQTLIYLASGLWLLWSAMRLWRSAPRENGHGAVTPARLAITTVLNPKTLVFAFLLFPDDWSPALLAYAGVFAGLVALTACGWIAIGALGRRGSASLTPERVNRLAAIVLALFAVWALVLAWRGLST